MVKADDINYAEVTDTVFNDPQDSITDFLEFGEMNAETIGTMIAVIVFAVFMMGCAILVTQFFIHTFK